MSAINDERREYMAGLMELMTDRCAMLGLVYTEEMATIVLAWLACADAPAARDGKRSPARIILPNVPPIPRGLVKTPRGRGVQDGEDTKATRAKNPPKPLATVEEIRAITLSPVRRASRFYDNGKRAAMNGGRRDACPYLDGRGGYQAAWLTGFDEAIDEVAVAREEQGGQDD